MVVGAVPDAANPAGRAMASRKDQLQSYQFLVQRFVSALIMRETDPAQVPFRRLAGAAFASVMVAVLALAGVGIYGLFRPGGDTSWQNAQAVIIEKETGTKFVLLDGVLHPVVNFISAVLIQGTTQTNQVSRASLVGYPRGARLGIADAPDSLPAEDQLVTDPWLLCVQLQKDASGAEAPMSTLVVGAEPTGGHLLGKRAVVVQERGSGAFSLITNDHRYAVNDSKTVLGALGLSRRPQLPATRAWLSALAAGQDIGVLNTPDIGNQSTARPGARVGQIFVVESVNGSPSAFYLASATELTYLTPMQAAIQLADDGTEAAYPDGKPRALELAASDAPDAAPPSAGEDAAPADPPAADTNVRAGSATCASFHGVKSGPSIIVDTDLPASRQGTPVAAASTTEAALVDRVDVEPGRAALIRALPSATADSGTLYLVTDDGFRHALSSADVVAMLGYGDAEPLDLPATVVARLPLGSAFDPKTAASPISTK